MLVLGRLMAVAHEETPLLCETNMPLPIHQWPVRKRKVVVDILAIWFGIGAWIAINGLFVQLPLLVQTQPEGWNLPSYLSIIVQIANIGPILYSILYHAFPGKIRDSLLIYIIMFIGTLALLLLALFYKKTTIIVGEERSTALFILVFFIALVGCTSSVLFLPYMGNFPDIYLISYFVGEGLSGFLPSIVALVQGVGGNPTCVNQTEPNGTVIVVPYTPLPKFSTEVYFIVLCVISAVSTICFFLLNNLPASKEEKVAGHVPVQQDDTGNLHAVISNDHSAPHASSNPSLDCKSIENVRKPSNLYKITNQGIYASSIKDGSINSALQPNESDLRTETHFQPNESDLRTEIHLQPNESDLRIETHFSISMNVFLLFIMSWASGLGNGIFPSIQSYSCLPYGNVVYHLSASLGSMANPLACFLAFFLPMSSVFSISVLTTLSVGFSSYIIATALTSPSPPLVNSLIGEIVIILCWILNTGFISYIKMSIASLYRAKGGNGLFLCGSVQQIGSAIAAVVIFFLINYAGIFTQYYPCM